MDENKNYATPMEEEEGIDFIELLRQLWDGRKSVIICTAIFLVLGLVAALTMKRTYSVSTVMVPQMNNKSGGGLSSLASLAGFDLGTSTANGELSPLMYPQIVSSVPFLKEVLYTPLHYKDVDTAISMYDYNMEYAKPGFLATVRKYTLGLPGVIMSSIRGKEPEITLPGTVSDSADEMSKPILLSPDEEKMLKALNMNMSLAVDKKEGYLTLSVTGAEPIQTAELALKAQKLLQDEITRFRTEKAEADLKYIQERYNEVKREAEGYQASLAVVTDRTQNLVTSRGTLEKERVQSKYMVANSVYMEMAKQLEQAKMQVKKDTPVFTIVQPVTIPLKPSNSRSKTLVIWTFLGLVLGCGIVLGKGYLAKMKEKRAEKEEATGNVEMSSSSVSKHDGAEA